MRRAVKRVRAHKERRTEQSRAEQVSLAARWLLPQNTQRKPEQGRGARKEEKRHIPTSK